jgi:hypothetical protein
MPDPGSDVPVLVRSGDLDSNTPVEQGAPPAAVRRAVGIALATVADARMAVTLTGLSGTLDALRGGTYVVSAGQVRFAPRARRPRAVVDGTKRGPRARLRIHGRGVPSALLGLRRTRRGMRVTGTVGGRRVELQVPVA